MTFYFDSKVQFLDNDAISTIGKWHNEFPIFAVASYSQDRGGCVTIFDDLGEPLRDISFPVHSTSQATALAWHPKIKLLVAGWENGEIHVWYDCNREFSGIQGPHKSPITLLEFSEQGGRMVSVDSIGLLTGWRCDNQYEFLTIFSHDLRDILFCLTFRRTVQNPANTQLSELARAAVAGDETALDTITNWRPKTAARNLPHSVVKDNHCFYISSQTGSIFYLNQAGMCTEVEKNDNASVVQILWHPKKETIITLREDLTITHYEAKADGFLNELDCVKLSGKIPGKNGAISWAGNYVAIIIGDFSVRMWDIETGDSYLLETKLENIKLSSSQEGEPQSGITNTVDISPKFENHAIFGAQANEIFTCIAYCQENQTLCAGTNQGNLYTWKRIPNYQIDVPENFWQLNNISAVRGSIKQCYWGLSETFRPCVMLNCISNVYLLKEQQVLTAHLREIWAIQKNANQIFIYHSCGKTALVEAEITITNLALIESNLIVSNGRSIVTYKISKDDEMSEDNTKLVVKLLRSFNEECLGLFIYDQNIFCLTSFDVKIFSMAGGIMLNKIQCNDMEGSPIGCDLNKSFLVIFTMNGYIKTYDVSRYEPKVITQPKSGYDLFDHFGEVIIAKCSANGTHVALTIANESLIPSSKLYVWDVEHDLIQFFEFLSHVENKNISRLPINFYWDNDDNRLLAIEARSLKQKKRKLSLVEKNAAHLVSKNNLMDNKSLGTKQTISGSIMGFEIDKNSSTGSNQKLKSVFELTESQIVVMFITEKCFIKELESVNLGSGEQLVNLCSPHVITLNINVIERIPLRDFKGLENCDRATREKVLDFSLNIALENMDLAFRCIRSIQSDAVWTNLAKMCVSTGRLDVAIVCLGHLKKAKSVRALRSAMSDDTLSKDAKVAVLAIELGMITEAEDLYRKCARFDLLNKLLQASGRIDEALQVAQCEDRVHLKNTIFHKAKLLQENGNLIGAIELFEQTQNSTQNVAHALLEDPKMLKNYMQTTTDKYKLKWWGQYIESTGDMESALKAYQKAEDWFSQVKILCYLNKLPNADTIARQSGDRAACYHLARHYENIGKYQEAVKFYTRAKTYSNAVRLCKENDLAEELWIVATSAYPRDKMTAAEYFESIGEYRKAVELYHRAGMLHKAIEMAFASEQPDTIQVIASELNEKSDPELINRCADFFCNIEQYQKATQLLANTKQYENSLEICTKHSVPITEELSELLTPEKGEISNEKRNEILSKLAELLQEQGDYHTATKKFTQAGNKVRAMKALLKSGDTEKVIFFAGVSRHREVYVMAANYLQALNWQNEPKILKSIITFYTKGQAYDSLANFYAVCAQIEIDDYRDYEKALSFMQDADKCLLKMPNTSRASDNLQRVIVDVKRILEIEKAFKDEDFHKILTGCQSLLTKEEKPPIRHSDISAYLVQGLIALKQYREALDVLRQLIKKDPNWRSRDIIQKSEIKVLADECGFGFETIWTSGVNRNQHFEKTSESEEEIEESLY